MVRLEWEEALLLLGTALQMDQVVKILLDLAILQKIFMAAGPEAEAVDPGLLTAAVEEEKVLFVSCGKANALRTVLDAILIQTAGELLLFSEIIEPGSFHLFYKVVVLFTLTFLYVYRSEMNKNYLLYWGIALLFIMGLEIRAIMTLGRMLI